MAEPEGITVTLLVTDALEALGVPYLIGGSLASALYGVVRSTLDADLVADLRREHVQPLVSALSQVFYVDGEAIREAIEHRSCFNVIHQETLFKVDVFAPGGRPFDRAEFARRGRRVLSREPERSAWFASAEDIVLAKLEWYRAGGEVSERQWRDVVGVLKTQAGRLDLDYLRPAAIALGVADLLDQAVAASAS